VYVCRAEGGCDEGKKEQQGTEVRGDRGIRWIEEGGEQWSGHPLIVRQPERSGKNEVSGEK
jgi:hypothetical protein